MEWMSNPQSWIAFATLLGLELVLGVDNIIFISILAAKLPAEQRNKARIIGLGLAMFMRIALLFSLAWIITLIKPLFSIGGLQISGRDLILIFGGLFLIGKATHEIHLKLEGEEGHTSSRVAPTFAAVIIQILMLDIVFSLDSVITAVGMVDDINIMISAVVVAVILMMAFAKPLSDFVDQRPTVKMLALSFLLLIGVMLLVDGFHQKIPKGYIYFAMGFSIFVEMLNLKLRKSVPVKLHQPYTDENAPAGASLPKADAPV